MRRTSRSTLETSAARITLAALLALGGIMLPATSFARARILHDAAHLRHALEKMLVVGRVLYIAAHPDDENTALLTYLAGERKVDAAYLSVTRGDGGQNLIGTEIATLLGVIRTHELLEARKLDGAWQFFTRAKDFGYSKSPDETLRIWGKEAVLGDMVWVIRRFRPDVIVTRFPEKGKSHGHHIASARLAHEAFIAAANPKRFPEQLRHVKPWRATRLVHNVSQWMLRRRGLLADRSYLSRFLRLDVGGYNPLFGLSYGEIAARSRSMHKSQGFGVIARLGPTIEYFQPIAGTAPTRDILDGVELGWRRFRGGDVVARKLRTALSGFRVEDPAASIPALVEALRAMRGLRKEPRIADKIRDLEELIVACAGLVLDVRAKVASVVPGGTLDVTITAINRTQAKIRLESVLLPGSPLLPIATALLQRSAFHRSGRLTVAANAVISAPSWLRREGLPGRYRVPDPTRAEQPIDRAPLRALFSLRIAGESFSIERPVRHVWSDRVRGELSRHVEITPPISVTPIGDVLMLPNGETRELVLQLRAMVAGARGRLTLRLPKGWRATPQAFGAAFKRVGDVQRFRFRIQPPSTRLGVARVVPVISDAGRDYSWREHTLRYRHIPYQTVLEPSSIKLVPLHVAPFRGRVGYIAGSGDLVPRSLRQIGVDVRMIDNDTLAGGDLSAYRTIVTGVRAFNVNRALRLYRNRLLAWVARGGTLIVQYNTTHRFRPLKLQFGPFPLVIGHERVTDEGAKVTRLLPQHPFWQTPNRLVPADFDGWVQERGLYFGHRWDTHYKPLLRIADPGEKPLDGSVLVAEHGNGIFVYTGLAFFRQLPAGVAGAYRMFLNLLALKQATPKRAGR
ncbi:MAG: PIG-L family deacetylase [Myxococcales bacterium]|nr:PIG-L family deacetylase [Myxococcales bacterium]